MVAIVLMTANLVSASVNVAHGSYGCATFSFGVFLMVLIVRAKGE